MAYDNTLHDEARRLQKEEGKGLRAIARELGGISPATVKAWLAETPNTDAGPVGVQEEDVTELLLVKARSLLLTIDVGEKEPKEQLEIAGAVDKLLGKYFTFTGQASEAHVTVDSSPELVAWAQKYAKTA